MHNCLNLFPQVNSCVLCKSVLEIKCRKDGKIISLVSDLKEVRNHYSVCFYDHGLLKLIVDPGKGNRDFEGKAVDEHGRKFRYKCQVPVLVSPAFVSRL